MCIFFTSPVTLFILLFGGDYRLEIIFGFILFKIIYRLLYWRRRDGYRNRELDKAEGSSGAWGREWVREKAIGSSVVQLTVRLLTVMGAKFRKQFSAGNKMNLDRLIGKCV